MRRFTIVLAALALSLTACGESATPHSSATPAPGTPENPLVGQIPQSSDDGRVHESATSGGATTQPATPAPGEKAAVPAATPMQAKQSDGAKRNAGPKPKQTPKTARPGDPVSKSG